MRRTGGVAALIVSIAFAGVDVTEAQCVTSDRTAGQGASEAYVLVPHGFPAELFPDLEDGFGLWNHPDCNTNGKAFPKFQLSGPSGLPRVHIHYSDGFNPRNAEVCGFYDDATDSVHIFGQFKRNGFTTSCRATDEQLQQTIAHELGHVLGLGNVGFGCIPAIMAPRDYDSNGRYKNRSVQTFECQKADDTHETPDEIPPDICGHMSTPFGELRRVFAAIGDCDDDGGGDGNGTTEEPYTPGTPIVVDLGRAGFRFTSLDDGVLFDLDADGVLERISWIAVESGDALLVLDRNANGWIDDGAELFGNYTEQPPSSEPNGFVALAVFDEDHDGSITPADSVFPYLRLWVDASHDGQSQPNEIIPLDEAFVRSIGVEPIESRRRDPHGNELRYMTLVRLSRGTTQAVDVFLLME